MKKRAPYKSFEPSNAHSSLASWELLLLGVPSVAKRRAKLGNGSVMLANNNPTTLQANNNCALHTTCEKLFQRPRSHSTLRRQEPSLAY